MLVVLVGAGAVCGGGGSGGDVAVGGGHGGGGNLTVDIDQHVLGGGLAEVAQAGHAVERARVVRSRPVDGEAPHDVEGDLHPIHRQLPRGELSVQGHLGPGRGHLAGQQCGPVGPQLNHLVVVGRRYEQLLGIW